MTLAAPMIAMANPLGRDTGPYSGRNSSKGALLLESQAVFRALAVGRTIDEIHRAVLQGELVRQRARETRRRIWTTLSHRFFSWNPPDWVLKDLEDAAANDTATFRFLVYIHYARRDRLTFDFATEKLKSMHLVRREDVLDFFAEREDRHPEIRQLRESTRIKLAGNVLTALREFGLLAGVQRKTIQRPLIPGEAVLHLCRLLYAGGLRGRTLLEASEWHLFLWDSYEIAAALGNLAQQQQLRFERSGQSVVLEIPMKGDGNDSNR